MRDPVDRFISAFNFHRVENGRTAAANELLDCFPLIDDLAMQLTPPNQQSPLTPCKRHAITAAITPSKEYGHISMGLSFYVQPVIESLVSSGNYRLVHTETLEADLASAVRWIGLDPPKVTLPRMRYSASLHLRNMTHISHVGRILLRHTLFHEYQMLEMLESRSTGQPAAVTEDGVFAMPVAAPAGEFTDAQIRRPDRDLPHGGRTPPSMLIKGAESS